MGAISGGGPRRPSGGQRRGPEGLRRTSSSQSSSLESKLAAFPSEENPDGDKLSGG